MTFVKPFSKNDMQKHDQAKDLILAWFRSHGVQIGELEGEIFLKNSNKEWIQLEIEYRKSWTTTRFTFPTIRLVHRKINSQAAQIILNKDMTHCLVIAPGWQSKAKTELISHSLSGKQKEKFLVLPVELAKFKKVG